MGLNFENYNYELFQDWQKNAVKKTFTIELEKKQLNKKRICLNYYPITI